MKTIPEVKADIELAKDYKSKTVMNNRIRWLKTVILFLESKPSEEFLILDLRRLNSRLDRINDLTNFDRWKIGKGWSKDWLKQYQEELGMKEIKNQIKLLNYILK